MPSSPRRPRPRFRTAVLASLSALGVAAAVAVPAPAHARAAAFEQRVLFRADRNPGYACFRIPALVRTTPSPRGGSATAGTPPTSTSC
jgi:sialidase-1